MVPKASVVDILDDEQASLTKVRKQQGTTHCNHDASQLYESTSFSDGFEPTGEIGLPVPVIQYSGRSKYSIDKSTNPENNDQLYLQLQSQNTQSSLLQNHKTNDSDNISLDESDKTSLLPQNSTRQLSDDNFCNNTKTTKNESAKEICLQTMFPLLMAGLGMVAVGIVLDKVQHWDVFLQIPEIFILVPALLGLKGNLEMTLASRLSTYANQGQLDDSRTRWTIVWGNMVVVEAQAMVIAFLASLVAMILGWIPDGKWENEHAIMLCTGSLLTGAIASGLLGFVMIVVVLLSTKCGINPDNVATPIAAALGDLITLLLLSAIVNGLYSVIHQPSTAWIGHVIIVAFVLLTPLFLYLSHRNKFTNDVIKHGWIPVIAAMGISSVGGLILDYGVSKNPGIAVFVPIINGVGGNLAAVQASRISTHLHTSKYQIGEMPNGEAAGCLSPYKTFFSSSNVHSVGARVMLFMVVPSQIVFVLIIQVLQAGHTSITPQFVAVYLLMSLIQVAILLQICNWMVLRLWKSKVDPDNSAIPYMTGLGDLLGTGLLALGFWFLWLIGDRDMDVGD